MNDALQIEIQKAEALCISAHDGQFRRDGVTHPFAVAEKVPDELKPAALLHDVLEDTTTTLADLFNRGFSTRTINAVWMVTRYKDNPYDSYMQVLMQSNDAVIVKIADMEHNLSCNPSENSKLKIAKWLPVLKERVNLL